MALYLYYLILTISFKACAVSHLIGYWNFKWQWQFQIKSETEIMNWNYVKYFL